MCSLPWSSYVYAGRATVSSAPLSMVWKSSVTGLVEVPLAATAIAGTALD